MGVCPKANCTSNRWRMGFESRSQSRAWRANLRPQIAFCACLRFRSENIQPPLTAMEPLIQTRANGFLSDTNYENIPPSAAGSDLPADFQPHRSAVRKSRGGCHRQPVRRWQLIVAL